MLRRTDARVKENAESRWNRSEKPRRFTTPLEAERWNDLVARLREPQFQEQLALYKRRENLDLVSAWAPPGATSLLKTDLLEEGFGKEKLLGPCANVPIRLAIGIFRRLEVLPTRFLAGRYIALRVLRK